MQDPTVLQVGRWGAACMCLPPPPARHPLVPQTRAPAMSTSEAQIQVLRGTFRDRKVSEQEKQIHVSRLRQSVFYVCDTSVYART